MGAAEAYIGIGQADKAIEVLEKGMEVTNDDAGISEFLKEIRDDGLPDTEKPIDSTNGEIVAQNNGGRFVKTGGSIYYREYSSDDFEDIGVFGSFSPVPPASTQVKRMNVDGSSEAMLEAQGTDGFYFINGKLYIINPHNENGTYAADLDGNIIKNFGDRNILCVDENRGIILFSQQGDILCYNILTDIEERIPNASFKYYDYSNGIIFFQEPYAYDSDQYDNARWVQTMLCSVNWDGSNYKTFVVTEPTLDNPADGAAEIINMQADGEYIYFSYGGFAGSGNFFQGGNISRAKIDGSDYEIITGVGGRGELCLIEEEERKQLIFDEAYDGYDQRLVSLSIDSRKLMPLGADAVFSEYSGKISNEPFFR